MTCHRLRHGCAHAAGCRCGHCSPGSGDSWNPLRSGRPTDPDSPAQKLSHRPGRPYASCCPASGRLLGPSAEPAVASKSSPRRPLVRTDSTRSRTSREEPVFRPVRCSACATASLARRYPDPRPALTRAHPPRRGCAAGWSIVPATRQGARRLSADVKQALPEPQAPRLHPQPPAQLPRTTKRSTLRMQAKRMQAKRRVRHDHALVAGLPNSPGKPGGHLPAKDAARPTMTRHPRRLPPTALNGRHPAQDAE